LRYRTTKFVRRNALGVGAVTAVSLAIVGGAIGTSMQARRAAREAERTANVRTFLENVFSQADPEHARGDSVTAGEMLDRARTSLDTAFASDLASAPSCSRR
jgi:cell division protein FtsX